MADKFNEEQVLNLLALLKTDALIDTKVHQINSIKSGIKQYNVPDNCVALLFEVIRTSMSSQHSALINAGFTTLNHLLVRLSLQDPKYIQKDAARTLPLVIEKAGDPRDKYRQLAVLCLTTYWKNRATAIEVEKIVKNVGLSGKNSRMKETMLKFIVQVGHVNFPSTLLSDLLTTSRCIMITICNSRVTSPVSWSFSKMQTAWSELQLETV